MRDVRKRPDHLAVIVSIALAMAVVAPGLLGAPSPGGDGEPRSAVLSPSVLMVNVNNTTSLSVLEDGSAIAGTDGGGIAEWAPDGNLTSVHTTVDGLPSNHIVALAGAFGDVYGITRADDTRLIRRDPTTGSWVVEEPIIGAMAPLRYLSGNGMLSVLDANGSIFLRDDTSDWEQPVLPLDPIGGWSLVECDGTTLVMSRGDDTLYRVDLSSGSRVSIVFNSSITDIDLHARYIAVATEDVVDIQTPGTGLGFNEAVKDRIRELGGNWAGVLMDDDSVHAVTGDGRVIDVDTAVTDPGDVMLVGNLEIREVEVNDVALRPDGSLLVATQNGIYSMEDWYGETFNDINFSQPTTNDLLGVGLEADILWFASEDGIEGLTFDSQGYPAAWLRGIRFESSVEVTRLQTILRDGTVHFAGLGSLIYTYDTFASDKPSRWGTIDPYDGPGEPILDIEVAGGEMFCINGDGLHVLKQSDTTLERVTGSPADVTAMYAMGDELFVGAGYGLWSYDVTLLAWSAIKGSEDWQSMGPVTDCLFAGGYHFAASEGSLYWDPPVDGRTSVQLSSDRPISSLAAREESGGAVWAVVEGAAISCIATGAGQVESPAAEGLGDARVRGVEVGPDGTAYLATDSGLHRVGQYRTQWTHYTTTNGLSANDLRDLELEPDGDDMWVAAYGGIDVLDTTTGETRRIGTEEGLPSNLVYDVEISDGYVHVGTDEGGAARRPLSGTAWEIYNASTGLVANDVQALAVLPDTILFGTDSGVTVLDLDGSTFSTHTTSSTGGGLPDDWVNCALAVDPDDILVGTAGGLGRYSVPDDTFEKVGVEGVNDVAVRALMSDASGRLWIGTDGGLVVLSGLAEPYEVVARVDAGNGLPSSEVLSIITDTEGWFWLGTSAGAVMVDGEARVHATFTTLDGLVHDRVTAMAERPEGTIWLGTAGGLSRLDKVRWDLRPQVSEVRLDIPDVYLTLQGVRLEPDEPSAGDEVTVNVTAFNPSGKRAIVTIALFEDDTGAPGPEVSRAIAYTEPGGSYNVSLAWEAVGGERNLWVVADPDGVVPETNERNNAVSISVHVNRPPGLRDANHYIKEAGGLWPERWVLVHVDVLYTDADGDPPVNVQAVYLGVSGSREAHNLTRVVGSGDLVSGARFMAELRFPYGNTTVDFTTSDGLKAVSEPLMVLNLNMDIAVSGLDPGATMTGEVVIDVIPEGPWEGEVYSVIEVVLVGVSTNDGSNTTVPFEWSVPELRMDVSGIEEGEYDLRVTAQDDRGLQGVVVVEGVSVAHDGGGPDLLVWAIGLSVVLVVVVAALVTMSRSRGEEG